MIPPKRLSKRQLGILMAGWVAWHTPDTKSVRPFKADGTGVLTTLLNGEPIYPADDDFQVLLTGGYVDPIGEQLYVLTEDANSSFADLATLYQSRWTDEVKTKQQCETGGKVHESKCCIC